MIKKNSRRKFDAAYKAQVALDALKGQWTLAELSSRYEVHAKQISKWKKKALEGLPGIFSNNTKIVQSQEEKLIASLYEEIGRLKVELDWLKKKSQYFS